MTDAQHETNRLLKSVSVDRLACLMRHWEWADEAMARFEQELAAGWNYDDNLLANHPFGSFYHWGALLCAFCEAALEEELLSKAELDATRLDLDTSLPIMRTCRERLATVPMSLEEEPLIIEWIRHDETLARLRRVHELFGQALQRARVRRSVDSMPS